MGITLLIWLTAVNVLIDLITLSGLLWAVFVIKKTTRTMMSITAARGGAKTSSLTLDEPSKIVGDLWGKEKAAKFEIPNPYAH